MNELIGRVFSFEKTVFPNQSALFGQLVRDGQSPKALMISCADSRIVPEQIMQAAPGRSVRLPQRRQYRAALFARRMAACPRPSNMPSWRWACATSSCAAIRTAAR